MQAFEGVCELLAVRLQTVLSVPVPRITLTDMSGDSSNFKWRLRVNGIKLRRVDDGEEDDFKTWALTTVAGSGGRQTGLWYANPDEVVPAPTDPNANLGKTSVSFVIINVMYATE